MDPPEVPPIQAAVVPMLVNSDSEDDEVTFLEEIERQPAATVPVPMSVPTTTTVARYIPIELVTPRIVSTYSVQQVRGQFTSSSSQPGSESDEEDDNVIPSTSKATQVTQRRSRFIAVKRTGGFVPRIGSPEDQALCKVRRSSRLSKPTPKMEQIVKDQVKEERKPKLASNSKKIIHGILPDNPGHCLFGFKSSVANAQSHVKLLTGGQRQGRQEDADSTKKNACKTEMEKADKVGKLKKKEKHYLVAPRKGSVGHRCVCKKQFKFRSQLNAHVDTLTGNSKFKCPLCQKKYFYYTQLKWHLKRSHKAELDSRKSLWGCSSCGETFPSNEMLCQHRKICSFIGSKCNLIFYMGILIFFDGNSF